MDHPAVVDSSSEGRVSLKSKILLCLYKSRLVGEPRPCLQKHGSEEDLAPAQVSKQDSVTYMKIRTLGNL